MKALFFAASLLCAAPIATASAEPTAAQHLTSVPLSIRTAQGVRHFQVEVARTGEQQEIGLMFRKQLKADRGMIFPMTPVRYASFWMKNTLIPLDMVFIRTDGTVSSIAAEATPLSLSPVESTEPVGAVLELAGGEAKRAGIRPGDIVRW